MKRDHRENLRNRQRVSWVSLYTVHREITDEHESWAYLCVYNLKKPAKIMAIREERNALSDYFWRILSFTTKSSLEKKSVAGANAPATTLSTL